MYFDCFGVEHILSKNENSIGNKYIITNIFRMQVYDMWIISKMSECLSVEFIDFIFNNKAQQIIIQSLTKYLSLL